MEYRNDNQLDESGFEWDENKRSKNLEKHHIDFADAMEIFSEFRLDIASKHPSEARRKATGQLEGQFVTVIYTMREGATRIISARRARKNEERAYRALYAGRDP